MKGSISMKNKFLFALMATALLSLSACKIIEVTEDELEKEINSLEVTEDQDIIDEISVVNASEGVYGNIYLPEEVNGAKITWWSSNEFVIYPRDHDDVAAGEVDRPSEDVTVTLKAKIEKDGVATKYEQDVLVKGLDYIPEDEDYEAYLFGHFVGESHGEGPQNMIKRNRSCSFRKQCW